MTSGPGRGVDVDRWLGALGILGGSVLLIAFLPGLDLSVEVNDLRLGLFAVGAIAIAGAAYRRGVAIAPRLALAGSVPVVVTDVGYLVAIWAVAIQDRSFGGTVGLAAFWIGLAMWLADAWLGIVTLRLGTLSRSGASALAVGSLLAILGMDRLGLTSPADPTIFGPLALTGLAFNGIGWILLGWDLVRGRVVARRHANA